MTVHLKAVSEVPEEGDAGRREEAPTCGVSVGRREREELEGSVGGTSVDLKLSAPVQVFRDDAKDREGQRGQGVRSEQRPARTPQTASLFPGRLTCRAGPSATRLPPTWKSFVCPKSK